MRTKNRDLRLTTPKKEIGPLYDQCEDRLCWCDSKRWIKKQVSLGRYRVRCRCGKFIGYFKEEGEAKNGRRIRV